ncbi:Pentatricopeptide repeat-containing protein [Quillaja saponaria]|uniref:Pentatricopeptide repeat-containing protein n=1 Tax=Quillaja saponaria TaxID=32244 RepID=A0AAD7KZ55_QUISA|nr:Pentatricopeptide repeat-containing protein [Quillaja saponaria]
MRTSNAKTLSTLFRSAVKSKIPKSKTTPPTSTAKDRTLKDFVSSLDPPSHTISKSKTVAKPSFKLPAISSTVSEHSSPELDDDFSLSNLKFEATYDPENPTKQLSNQISSILCGDESISIPEPQEIDDEKTLEKVFDIPWFATMSHGSISLRRKEVCRERKQKWIFKCTQVNRFGRLVQMCADSLGTEATIQVFGKLGRETGLKEYNALIGICIDKARESDDEDIALEQIGKAFHLFKSLRAQGFQLEEETYRPLLMYLIDMGMVEEFHFFSGIINEENPNSASRLGYYEMMLWLGLNNEEKIRDLCEYIAVNDGEDNSNLGESYLLALCESNRKKELIQLLEIIDITKLSSTEYVTNIFKSLGRLLLESYAEKLLFAFKTCDYAQGDITNFIATYAVNIPNLAVEDVILKFQSLHSKLDVSASSSSYEKLILYCCDSLKVHVALDTVDEMCQAGLTLSIEVLHSILRASKETYEFNLVRRIHSVICRLNLKANSETFRSMISLHVKMKDFVGAYDMLDGLEKMSLKPTASMYNAIMAGYFRERNISSGLKVLERMKRADVKPDSQTFSYLISNCENEEDIMKYYEEMKTSGVQATKQTFMALINAYAKSGQFVKAKQIASDKAIPIKSLNEIKSVLVSALASHGQMSEALVTYEEIKEAGYNLEPKAVISLIEHTQLDGQVDKLLLVLKELNSADYWVDGCCRIILYCVRYKHLSTAVDLLKQLKDKFCSDELVMEVLFDEVFSLIAESEQTHLQIGLDLLRVIKDELGLLPSRKCLDFLLNACASAKDLHNTRLIWIEYEAAGLPYNVLTFLRMYQALLASGDYRSAKLILHRIPKDDPHVCSVLKACQKTYIDIVRHKRKKKEKYI